MLFIHEFVILFEKLYELKIIFGISSKKYWKINLFAISLHPESWNSSASLTSRMIFDVHGTVLGMGVICAY